MLRTTREAEREIQPLATADGDLVLTADARLDNREALIVALGLRGSPHEDITDADLILASYRSWGERCVEHWIGDFGLVIWDSLRRRLFCARDPFGVKPLYYHYTPGRLFAFASEVETLLVLEDVPDEIDEFEVARHLFIPLGSDVSATYYRQVRRLMPAHVLVVSDQHLETHRYWQLDPTRELRLSSDGEYAEALRETFVEAVRCRLRSATPVASMLSGGIDSASITCVAANLLEDVGRSSSLHTLSAVYPSVPSSDEREFIEDVLRKYRMVPHFLAADAVNPIAAIDRMNRLVGGANWGANLYLNWMLYGVAAEAGAGVVLEGFDGDSTLSHGTGYLTELAMAGRWLKLALTSIPYSRRRGRRVVSSYLDLVRYGLRHPSRDTAVGSLVRRLRGRRGKEARPDRPPTDRNLLLNADFARRFSDRAAADPDPPMTEREFHLRKLTAPVLFEVVGWLEACAAGRGVEVRLPFCDIRLAELCLSIPPDQKIRRGWTRFVMRRAMEGFLPPALQWRQGKSGLHAGWVRAWRSTQDGRIEAMLTQPSPVVRRYLDPERVLELHRRFLNGEPDNGEGRGMWRALSLALWLSSRNV
jgi:asparagine synthase (glutamine-hydrolysing)